MWPRRHRRILRLRSRMLYIVKASQKKQGRNLNQRNSIAEWLYGATEQGWCQVKNEGSAISALQQYVGEVIRRRREELGLSVRTLADKVGFSPSFISQVENGQVSPSIASLERIGLAVGLTLAKVFEAADTRESAVVRAGGRRSLISEWSRAKIEWLSPSGSALWLEPLMVTIDPQGTSGKKVHSKPEEEFAIIFEGQVLLTLGEKDYRLDRGDSVLIPANTPHRWVNDSSEPASILMVTHAPGRVQRIS
jgi:XRE family transcriptional regulator, regulator of sulfur utilization